MGWGLDVHWAALAAQHGWRIGVVDATPILHLQPAAETYPRDEAVAEAQRVPRRHALRPPRRHPNAEDPPLRAPRRRGVLPALPRPGARASGRTARRSPRRRPAPRCASRCCYRPIPPRAAPQALGRYLRQPPRTKLDGITIDYVPFVSPPRSGSYGRWGAWAAPSLAAYLHRYRRSFDVIHAHNAVPAGDAVRRARIGKPLVVSVHGGDVYFTAPAHGDHGVRRVFESARLVLANSSGIAPPRARPRRARGAGRAPRRRRARARAAARAARRS